MTFPALLQGDATPDSRLYRALHRVADRLEPELRDAFLEALRTHRDTIDLQALETALRTKNAEAVIQALGVPELTAAMHPRLEVAYRRALLGGGEAVAQVLGSELGIGFSFDRTDPGAVLAARRDAGTLIVRIDDEARDMVRGIVGDMFTSGVPPDRAAVRIRDVVGLTRRQAGYVENFRDQLRQIRAAAPDDVGALVSRAVDRRLDAVTKQRIRSAALRGELTEELIDEVAGTYRDSLNNRRALNIGRTESIRAAHAGQHQSHLQAVQGGHISRENTRRFPVVTPDDRLRPSHAAIPGMNPEGVGLTEPFRTPDGPKMYPPFGVSCRCSVSLLFSGGDAVL